MPSKDSEAPDCDEGLLAFYKSQIQTLESELADFQASSRELEQELEKELEASEKQHRDLRNKNEALRYEVDEWKNKYKQSKAEANSAQNILQKEITMLREQNRTIQLKLRDIEVTNDDFERQERIVKSSLEDLEHKYNQGIERGVMLEEEIRIGEQERESLRIEVQRLRDEISDMKVEQDITVEKLNNTLAVAARYGNGSLHHVPPPSLQSPMSETSSSVTSHSPTTPTTASAMSTSTPQSDHSPTPPSPPMSEISTSTSSINDPALTPRPRNFPKTRQNRGPSFSSALNTSIPLPPSRSLHQIRGLIGQMQRLEQRVHHARSKLPGPVSTTPPKASPARNSGSFIPTNGIILRSPKKHRSPSMTSSATSGSETFNSRPTRISYTRLERPESRAAGAIERPASRMEQPGGRSGVIIERSASRTSGMMERPTSRASSHASGTTCSSAGLSVPDRSTSRPPRPVSRNSVPVRSVTMGTHAEFGMTPTFSNRRDRASMDSYAANNTLTNSNEIPKPTQTRRNTIAKDLHLGGSAIPKPASGLPRRNFGARRISSSTDGSDPSRFGGHGYGNHGGSHGSLLGGSDVGAGVRRKKLTGVGETY